MIRVAISILFLVVLVNLHQNALGQTKLDYLKHKLSSTMYKVDTTPLNKAINHKMKLDGAKIYCSFKDLTVKNGNENDGLIVLEGLAIFNTEIFYDNLMPSNKAAPNSFIYKATFKQVLDDYETDYIEILYDGKTIKIY